MKTKNLFLAVSSLIAVTIILPTFSFTQGTWTQKANFPGTGRYLAANFSIGNKGYIGIGYPDVNITLGSNFKDFWEWDQTTNVWTKKADYPGTSGGIVASFSIGTKGYIGTGQNSSISGFTNDFWEYNPATNSWTQKASLPSAPARSWAVGFSIGTKGYIGTGTQDRSGVYYYQDFWEWDQTTDVWTQKANFGGSARSYAVGFSIGTKGYIGIGEDVNNVDKKDFWEWDQTTNVWTKKADFVGTARGYAKGFSIGTKGYIVMGLDASWTVFKDLWEWDQNTNIWVQKANVGTIDRAHAIAFSIGNKGYTGIGGNGVTAYNDFWEYDPSAITGIVEVSKENIFLYPNPTSGRFIIKNIEPQMTKCKLEIFNILGRKIYSISNYNQRISNEIDISNAPKGFYIIKIHDGEKFYSEKIVIR
jgi:N-acetylneuraminic acid mutarotase